METLMDIAGLRIKVARRWLRAALAALPLVAGEAAYGRAEDLVSVTVRVDVFFYGSHVPILLGIVDGIYKKYGLDVTAMPGRGSATTIQTVAAGTDTFGFADGGTLVKFAAQGLKEKMIVGMLEKTPALVLAMPDSGIKQPSDLNGHIGGFGNGSAPEQLFPAFAKATGVDIDSIKHVAVDIPTRDNLFLQKKIDFSFGYAVTQLPLLEEKCDCKLNVMRYSDHNITSISNGIVVSDQYAAEHPDVVRKFAQATVEAINLAVKDPDAGIKAFFDYAKDSKLSKPVVERQWQETLKLLHTDANSKEPVGATTADDWKKTIALLEEYGGLPKDSVTPEMVSTNQYLAK
jgi:NitT/TauT family transport system substrate-binding protein